MAVYHGLHQIVKYSIKYFHPKIVFCIDFNKKMFLEHQISIWQSFLKERVTLKTGVIAAEDSALPSQEYNYI